MIKKLQTTSISHTQEFDRQVKRLLDVGYPKLAGMTKKKFTTLLEPLRNKIPKIHNIKEGSVPFLIVVQSTIVPPENVLPLLKIKNMHGEVRMDPLTPEDFSPITGVTVPESNVYLLIDVDTGQGTLNVTPHDALLSIHKAKRSPLTIDEGVALVLQFPEVLTDKKKYNCFSMLASRHGDKRVPALWVSYKKPRLGWCWDNNPHTWLGSASCAKRIGL
jgi:hypothetical protein